MPQVVLDTNILRENGIQKPNMVMLARLAREKMLDVYIPTIVKREYLSQQFIEMSDECQKISNSLLAIKKRIGINHPNHSFSDNVGSLLKDFKEELEIPIYESFEEWIKSNNIKEFDFSPHDIHSVIDEYFSGSGVFKKAKHRDDFPDAMISKGISSLAECEPVTVLCKDGNFKDKLSTFYNVRVLSSLREYLDTEEITTLLTELDERTSTIDLVKEVLRSKLSQKKFKEFILSEDAYIEDVYLTSEVLKGTELLLLQSAYNQDIQFIDTSTITDVVLGEVRFVSDNSYVIDVQFNAKAAVSYAGYYGDFHALDDLEQDRVDFDSLQGDGYGECSELRDVAFTGSLEIYIDDDLAPDQLAVHMEYFSYHNTRVSGTVEIISGEILPIVP
ncbi:PIN domain-containing protein [Vibrio chagasii]|uniref:PIN domain-containing protein n=1 Tax=Vibrio chagasii TaxID=170679 RepID=UPI003DA8E809